MSEKFDLKTYLEERRKLVNRTLEGYLPAVRGPAFRVVQAMHYSLFVGGKRLRPILCLAAAQAVGGDPGEALPDLLVNPLRPGRSQPRVIKDRNDSYPRMTRPRAFLKQHPGYYGK